MNTFCHTVYCIYVQINSVVRLTECHNINKVVGLHATYVSSEKAEAL